MDNQATVTEMLRFSWKRGLAILSSPETGKFFDLRRWFKILIIVWLAGAGVSGLRGNFRAPAKTVKPSVAASSTPAKGISVPSQASIQGTAPGKGGTQALANEKGNTGASAANVKSSEVKKTPPFALPVMIGLGIIGLCLGLVFMWLSSRFNFVLLDTLVKGTTEIKAPFHEHKEIGNAYFKWNLGLMGIFLGTFLVIGVLMALLFWIAKGNTGINMMTGVIGGLLIVAAVLVFSFIGGVVQAFVTPVVYRDKTPIMETFQKVMKAETFAIGKVVKYALVCVGLWILAAIAQGILGMLVGFAGLLAGGLVALPGYFLIKALPFLKVPLIVLGGILASVLILAVIVLIGLAMLPVSIFFRVFSLTYLTRLYPECDLLGFTKA